MVMLYPEGPPVLFSDPRSSELFVGTGAGVEWPRGGSHLGGHLCGSCVPASACGPPRPRTRAVPTPWEKDMVPGGQHLREQGVGRTHASVTRGQGEAQDEGRGQGQGQGRGQGEVRMRVTIGEGQGQSEVRVSGCVSDFVGPSSSWALVWVW